MEQSSTHEVIDNGLNCTYEVPDQLTPSASTTIGDWDGSDAAVEQLVSANSSHFDDPVERPDLGDAAALWEDPNRPRSILVVFVDGHYYTETVWGPDSPDTRHEMLTKMFQQASS